MKVSVLVAAAIAITCVNASGDGGLLSCLGHSCGSKSGLPWYKFGQHSRLKPRKKNPVCDPIVTELSLSWGNFVDLDYRFWKQEPDFYDLMTGNGKEWEGKKMGEDGDEKDKMHDLNTREIQTWLKENPVAIPGLQEIKEESIGLKECHLGILEQLLDSKCSTEGLDHLSPAGMTNDGYFLQWDFEINPMSFGEQQNHI
ncbi:hypothetical protein BASA60_000074 [Batrachochytrium salamandrivorans]|nr:hypothetical protein BASA60_000074 [Batrachochytrium salamandrivorans]KAH9268478.1 hypothetical protein BASA83_009321 [Batrachochytrium salamandrivorans]